MIPGFDRLYSLTEHGGSRAFRVDLELDDEFAVTRREIVPDEPIAASWKMGATSPSDVIWTTYAVPLLVSDRVIALLEQIGADGWSTYEVTLTGKGGAPIAGYHGLSVYGRCGAIDDSKSVEVMRLFPGGVFPMWRGLQFEPDTWDGSDFFMPVDRSGWIIVSDKVKCAFAKAKVKNVVFERLDEIEREPFI